MKDFKKGDLIDTTEHGFVLIRCPMAFDHNKNPNYDKLGGRTLYWVEDVGGNDILLWDTELHEMLIENEVIEFEEDSGEWSATNDSDFEW